MLEKLRNLARDKGITLEELVIEVLDGSLSLLDSNQRLELHLELCERYLRQAQDFANQRDPVQASEKAWKAAAQILKAVAAAEGKQLKTHAELWKYFSQLWRKLGDEELRILWDSANVLHVNFYENWLSLEEVEIRLEGVRRFVQKLRDRIRKI